jgi:hypothetical protein
MKAFTFDPAAAAWNFPSRPKTPALLKALLLRDPPLFRLAHPFPTSFLFGGEKALVTLRIARPTPELALRLLDGRS